MKYLSIEKAIDGFIGYAKIQGIATSEIADSKIANLAYANMVKAYEYLKTQKAFEEMKLLLINEDTFVRLWSASYLLNVYEEEALIVLEEIKNEKRAHSFIAEMTIEEWKKGNLNFF